MTEHYWKYTSEPNPGLGGNPIYIGQGRVLGGGSAVNGMAYCRGSASVFDEWARLSGNGGLAWNSLLNSFKATSHYVHQPAPYRQVTNRTGYGFGPLEVSQTSDLTGFDFPFAMAVEETFGVREVDLTDGTGIGLDFGLSTIHAHRRTRSYPRNTFGLLMQSRRNVKVIPHSWVYKIGFEGKTAKNVTYLDTLNNQNRTLSAREIIVSGGAINTPKLLLQSGVGPQAKLSSLGIPVVADSPAVGASLYDHPLSIIMLRVTPDIKTMWQWLANETASAIALQSYAADRSGPLGWSNGYVYAAFRLPDSVWAGINGTHYTSMAKDRPHVLIEYTTVPFMAEAAGFSAVTAWTSLVQPESSGHVTLKTANWRDDPEIQTNYFGTPADKAAILYSYKMLREMLKSPRLRPVIVEEFYPGPAVTTDAQIWASIQAQTYSFRHPLGSVPIGKALNSNWRLKGLNSIRVVDISTFPSPPTCHPQADVYALAHRAALDIQAADRR
jgi:choline dehydrogenase-like flavoprotein